MKTEVGVDSQGANSLFTLGVTGDQHLDLALRTTEFDPSIKFTQFSPDSPPETDRKPQLHNVVATMNVGCGLDLRDIVAKARNVEYNPKRFSALVMRIRTPKSTALMFNSGKIVITGAKSEPNCRLAGRKFTRILQKLGYSEAKFTDFKVQNLVATCGTNFPIRLEGLLLKHQSFANYEPELFPGLIYRMLKPKVVLLVFVSGQVVFTGAKVYEDVERAWRCMRPVLEEFRKEGRGEKKEGEVGVGGIKSKAE